MTLREIVYMCLDELKLHSDDAEFNEQHVAFLANKYRAFLLKQQYSDIKKEIPQSNYQTICLDLEDFTTDICGQGTSLRSVQAIPDVLPVGSGKITPVGNYFAAEITYVSRDRLRYVGNNRYLQNILYAALGPDNHIYLKSQNPHFKYLQKIQYQGIFEDSEKAAEFSCSKDNDENVCDPMDKDFPLEPALTPMLIQAVVKELAGPTWSPSDNNNDGRDDLANLAYYIRRNLKSDAQKKLDGTDD